MLARRHLRHRILQALYSYYQGLEKDVAKTEKELLHGIDRSYDLYIFLLLLLMELADHERIYIDDVESKFLTRTAKKYVHHLSDNVVIKALNDNPDFKTIIKRKHISWQDDIDLLKKIFNAIKVSEEYTQYILTKEHEPESQVAFIAALFKKFAFKNDFFSQSIEEKNIYWANAFEFCCEMVLKTIKSLRAENNFQLTIPAIYKDVEDDKSYIHLMLFNTIKNNSYFEELINAKTKNWDVDRIALMDIILMKMCLCEIIHVESVPVKVSINEYLEVAKEFSTPKSRIFINGVIDKIVAELKSENKIVKTGRGLME